VATTQLLPIYSKLSEKIKRRTPRLHVVGGTEIVAGMDRFWLALRCPMHAWSWPRANKDERLGRYDSHQTCHKCTSRRMFDTHEWHAGPIYKSREHSA
jgi:6-phosphogluconolactonase/glucosamine-6-phosphate isomerase/deaminase